MYIRDIKSKSDLSFFHEFFKKAQHFLNLCGVILEVFSGVNNKDVFAVIGLEPLFMFVVNHSEVFQGNFTFFLSLSFLGSLIAFFRGASQVDHLGFFNVHHGFKTRVEGLEHFILALVHVSQIFHQLRENIFVSQYASL